MNSLRFCLAVTILFSAVVAKAQMSAHYINVGQADSILLEFKEAAILIDAGGEATGDTRDRDHLIDYLNKFFARRTDLNRTLAMVIISNPHIDHTKNLGAVMQTFRVQRLLDGGSQSGSGIGPLKAARTAAGNRYRAIRDSQIVATGRNGWQPIPALMTHSNVDLRILAASRGCENGNNDSLIVLVRHIGASYLFAGDAETEADDACLGEIPETIDFYNGTGLLDVDVYKVGHHGSKNATDEAFLEAMTPKIAVISAGRASQKTPGPFHAFQFGHPRESVVALLEDALTLNRAPKNFYTMTAAKKLKSPRRITKSLYCTCWDGDIVVSTDGTGPQYRIFTGLQTASTVAAPKLQTKAVVDWRKRLSEQGPQFSRDMQDGEFSMVAFVKGGWSMVLEYELERDAIAELKISTLEDEGIADFVTPLKASSEGQQKKVVIELPSRFGDNPLPALVSIRAVVNTSGDWEIADFHLRGLGLGLKASNASAGAGTSSPFSPITFLVARNDSARVFNYLQSEQIQISVSPDSINASQGGRAHYTFAPDNTFPRWAAEFRSVQHVIKNGRPRTKTIWVRTDLFDEEAKKGSRIKKEWDGYDAKKKISLGENRLVIRAWFSAALGAASAIRVADQVIRVN